MRPAGHGTSRSGRLRPARIGLFAVLILIALFFIVPLLWMVSTSLKGPTDAIVDTGWIPQRPTFDNFRQILSTSGDTPVFRWLLNSAIVSGVGTLLSVLLTSLSAYAFARIDFPGKGLLFSALITTLLLPSVMFLVPQFLVINWLGLYNTIPALMLPGLAGVFGVFFMRQFFLGIPLELEEAAYVDGANRFRTFRSVVLPLARPAIATLSVITFLAFWNDYLWPLIACQGDGCTLPPGLATLQGQFTAQYGLLMAGAVLAAIPVLVVYLVAQRWIVQSVTSAGIKG
ncbi:MAG: carbohydrate ABC transporter permease [Chloroflexi bacterium]|nr:MAG: carbohydrate ABC transporter permease [Chloroflexota bacterium]